MIIKTNQLSHFSRFTEITPKHGKGTPLGLSPKGLFRLHLDGMDSNPIAHICTPMDEDGYIVIVIDTLGVLSDQACGWDQ